MKPMSMAANAPPMLVMAKGMQNGFILRCPCVVIASTAPANECIPPMAEPISAPLRCRSSFLLHARNTANVMRQYACESRQCAHGAREQAHISSEPSARLASWSAFLAATTR